MPEAWQEPQARDWEIDQQARDWDAYKMSEQYDHDRDGVIQDASGNKVTGPPPESKPAAMGPFFSAEHWMWFSNAYTYEQFIRGLVRQAEYSEGQDDDDESA